MNPASPAHLGDVLAPGNPRAGATPGPRGKSEDFRETLEEALAPAHERPVRPDREQRRGPKDPHAQQDTHARAPEPVLALAAGVPQPAAGTGTKPEALPQPQAQDRRQLQSRGPALVEATQEQDDGAASVSAAGIVASPRARARAKQEPDAHRTGVVRLRPTDAQLAARLGVKPVPRSSPGARPDGEVTHAGSAGDREEVPRERAREPARPLDSSTPLPARTDTPPLTLAHDARDVRATGAPGAPSRAAAVLPPPPDGHEVAGAVLRSAAHLKVDAGALGALELHLRVRDGALHLRVGGEAAHLVEARAGELSRALASDGLKLAPVELPPRDGTGLQGGAGGQGGNEERRDAWTEAREARGEAPPPRKAATPAADRAGPVGPAMGRNRIDVKA